MARSVQTIYDSLIAEKESLSSLDSLAPMGETYSSLLASITSASKTAIWRLILYVVAYFTHLQESLWDLFKIELEALLAKAKYGSLRWYVEQAKAFQFGDTLTFQGNFPVYDPIDLSARIVTQASAQEDAGASASIFVKVAKGTAILVPLSSPELAAFTAYMNDVKPAGISLSIISLNADTLRLVMEIGYDAIRPLADVQVDLENAIINYLKGLPFDGKFRRLAFEDTLQAVPGILTISTTSMLGFQGLVQTTILQEYVAGAGYMTWDEANSTITYTAV